MIHAGIDIWDKLNVLRFSTEKKRVRKNVEKASNEVDLVNHQ